MSTATSDQYILETDKFGIRVDKHGNLFGDVAYSDLAPDYILQDGLRSSSGEEFDSSTSRTLDEVRSFRDRVLEEDRLSKIYQLRHSFSLRADNRAFLHPDGTTDFDYKSIAEERKTGFEKLKFKVRQENYDYLGKHPEVQAIISLAIKKLLQATPAEPVSFLTEFFTHSLASVGSQAEFLRVLKVEMDKIGRYHRMKMKASGKIRFKPTTEVLAEASGDTWRAEKDINCMKNMNIGALASNFCFTEDCTDKKKIKKTIRVIRRSVKKVRTPRTYCGCKDYKLKKNQDIERDLATTLDTLSVLDSIRGTALQTTEDLGDGAMVGDGHFIGEIVEPNDGDQELTQEEAATIASKMLSDILGGKINL